MNRCFLTNYGVNEEAINIRNVLCTLQILIQHHLDAPGCVRSKLSLNSPKVFETKGFTPVTCGSNHSKKIIRFVKQNHRESNRRITLKQRIIFRREIKKKLKDFKSA